MEDKDRPTQLSDKKMSELGSTVGIMLKICEQMFGTGKAVVIDSGFCVVEALLPLVEIGRGSKVNYSLL